MQAHADVLIPGRAVRHGLQRPGIGRGALVGRDATRQYVEPPLDAIEGGPHLLIAVLRLRAAAEEEQAE